jgi:hypothetical protein
VRIPYEKHCKNISIERKRRKKIEKRTLKGEKKRILRKKRKRENE